MASGEARPRSRRPSREAGGGLQLLILALARSVELMTTHPRMVGAISALNPASVKPPTMSQYPRDRAEDPEECLLHTRDRQDPVTVNRFVDAERAHFWSLPCAESSGLAMGLLGLGEASAGGPLARRLRADRDHPVHPRRHTLHQRRAAGPCRAALRGTHCSRQRVARLMRPAGLEGVHRRRLVWIRSPRTP